MLHVTKEISLNRAEWEETIHVSDPKIGDNGFVVGGGVVFPVGIAINWFKS